jgi:hypothetical protein
MKCVGSAADADVSRIRHLASASKRIKLVTQLSKLSSSNFGYHLWYPNEDVILYPAYIEQLQKIQPSRILAQKAPFA